MLITILEQSLIPTALEIPESNIVIYLDRRSRKEDPLGWVIRETDGGRYISGSGTLTGVPHHFGTLEEAVEIFQKWQQTEESPEVTLGLLIADNQYFITSSHWVLTPNGTWIPWSMENIRISLFSTMEDALHTYWRLVPKGNVSVTTALAERIQKCQQNQP